jgi:hypothetical protein
VARPAVRNVLLFSGYCCIHSPRCPATKALSVHCG